MNVLGQGFPHLQSADDTAYFENQIVSIHFNTLRSQGGNFTRKYHEECNTILRQLKRRIRESAHPKYLGFLLTLYKMVGYTRDIHEGKGEREISYTLLMSFYEVFPSLAIYIMHNFVSSKGGEPAYGSWRDIPQLCDFLKNNSRQGYNHALIAEGIACMNRQLTKDMNVWKYAELSGKEKKCILSNVAKWIPREGKQYSWVFDKMASQWAETHYPYLLKTAKATESGESLMRAHSKQRFLYRKTVSKLNRALETPEIQMCNGQWKDIAMESVPLGTYLKHSPIFLNNPSDTCPRINNMSITLHATQSQSPSMGYLVRRSISILEKLDQTLADTKEILYINKEWKKAMKKMPCRAVRYMIPMVDVSSSMRERCSDTYTNAIGMAILLGSHSSIQNRMIAMDSSATWIGWSDDADFITIVQTVMEDIRTMQNTTLCFENALHVITETILGSQSSKSFIDQLFLVVISDYNNGILDVNIETNMRNGVSSLHSYKRNQSMPHVIYLNVDEPSEYKELAVSNQKHYFVSGYSNIIIKHIIEMIDDYKSESTVHSSYESLTRLTSTNRYKPLDDYVIGLFANA